MYIEYRTNKLKKRCLKFEEAQKAWGKQMAKKIMQRISEILAAPTLEDLNRLPPTRCHKLSGDREGQYAVDLEQPCRLIFEPIGAPEDIYADGILDRAKVKGIKIVEVGDYH
jgi:proteic killer suppression protein